MDRKHIRTILVDSLESFVKFFYGWISDNNEALSKMTYALHIFILLFFFSLIFVCHVIYPVFWFQVIVFIISFVVWIQHIILHMCVCTSLEIKLGGKDSPIAVDPLLELFNIPINRETRIGVTILMTTLFTLFLGLELVARSIMFLREYYGFSLWV